jgi:type I restriction enzyme S subunit
MLELAIGSTFLEISKSALESIKIQLPNPAEQQAITTTLSDTDEFIALLEKLIVKKRAIKRGAMQELLFSVCRLPEFKGKWEVKKIGKLCNVQKGETITGTERKEGRVPVVAGGIGIAYYHNRANRNANTISISASGANAGFVNFWNCEIFASDCTTIEESDRYDVRFVYQTLLNSQNKIYALQTGGAQPHVQPPQLRELEFSFPTSIAEQVAIAEMLSDMDAEIDALTAKLNKLRNIKRGMMSELLTGRIRLADIDAVPEIPADAVILPKRETARHNQQFDDAVMIAGIVDALYSDKYPLGRKKVQKCLYLLRRHQYENTEAFRKMEAGPYANAVRYEGGEPIAKRSNYITTSTAGGKGTVFAKGSNIGEALEYIERWGKKEDIRWLSDKLKFKKVDDLELLATVDMAICDLKASGTAVSVATVKKLIAADKKWKAKLQKPSFSDDSIEHAIRELKVLL